MFIRKIDWKLFLLFLIICLFIGFLLIYWLFPGYFSEKGIKKVPIIIDEDPGEVWKYPEDYPGHAL